MKHFRLCVLQRQHFIQRQHLQTDAKLILDKLSTHTEARQLLYIDWLRLFSQQCK